MKIRSTVVPLPIDNIDTDQIVPARFLKATDKNGFGKHLFRDWRDTKKNFVLNNPRYKGEILLVGKNFGSGSSREHAAWALKDYGFKAIVASSFADIFKNNALSNGLLPVEVTDGFSKKLFALVAANPKTIVEIDLAKQEIRIPKVNMKLSFPISPYKKLCLIEGYDDIDYLLSLTSTIEQYEKDNRSTSW